MSGAFFVDSNILIYAYDRSQFEKKRRTRTLLDWLQSSDAGIVSTQVLAEFFWVVTRKLKPRLSLADGYAQLEAHLRAWRVVEVSPAIVLEAARGVVAYQLPYWDAQVWATAKLNQIPKVLSEDFQHQRRIEGVEFLNPFKARVPGEV